MGSLWIVIGLLLIFMSATTTSTREAALLLALTVPYHCSISLVIPYHYKNRLVQPAMEVPSTLCALWSWWNSKADPWRPCASATSFYFKDIMLSSWQTFNIFI